jgi:exopolyphosphatase/guanosine-5'-triphosphate,3'-diphosphate pyrophosphatase
MSDDVQIVGAVDLGSNSFHMLVARVVGGEVHVVDKLKERVALAEGLDAQKNLTDEARARALAVIGRFGERLAHMPDGSVRAVGTNTLRAARDPRGFLSEAESALGHPIEIISGREEARLIYLGVAHTSQGGPGRRLVIDIGGGSTECIIGEGFEPIALDSLFMGHISWTQRFFPDGVVTRERMQKARVAAGLELESIVLGFKYLGWTQAVGASGTALAVEQLIHANALGDGHGFTAKSLRKLRKAIVAAGHVDRLALAGLQETRRPVIAGGVAILQAVFDNLGITEMRTSQGALREGLVYDQVGRMRHEDVRDRTVRQLQERFHVDVAQADRVSRTALSLLDQVSLAWKLPGERSRQALRWSAALHEIGLALTYTGYHKHGAYIIENSDMPGFSKDGQRVLARMVAGHRRKLRPSRFEDLASSWSDVALKLCVLLRLAWRLNRSRDELAVPRVWLEVDKKRLRLSFPDGWLEEHTLARADIDREVMRLTDAGYVVEVGAQSGPHPPDL